ncbi:Hsp20/alpha crystallin family protein [Halomicroarcula sp. S1AR25-4]|uniref:Hsp20/alpha crystallin family protein n=1 Tax=Haloarcula sp. S1AR25-4 TaxID=2950538 RepID=UPI002876C39E|nr:Hsp20/alpha crystallin family protein [Halomicroarcula sp. S1AR25-4]MDS0278803.1 Hsp20/alpha crystallin family protein [Halomicroarcula sp. S1AR25-4]
MSDRDPLSELERAFDTLSEQFGVDVDTVPTDILDEGDAFVVHADLPGFDSADLDVQLVEERKLTITADHSEESETTDGRYVQRERRRQSASRTVRLPEAVDEEGTSASYEEGVLTVRLPKVSGDADDGTDIPVN